MGEEVAIPGWYDKMDTQAAIAQALGPQEPTETLLTAAGLSAYVAYFAAEGYTYIPDLLDADDEDVDELIQGSGMKKPEARRLRKALAAVQGGEGFPPANSAAPARLPEAVPPGPTVPKNLHTAGQKKQGSDEPEPEPEPQFVETSTGKPPAARRAFGSMRFDGVVPLAASEVQAAMAEKGCFLEIINMNAGGDIDQAIQEGILNA
eukprot:COSAG05_NODE_7220_length_841_cov_1.421833_1_plen_205_part_01